MVGEADILTEVQIIIVELMQLYCSTISTLVEQLLQKQ